MGPVVQWFTEHLTLPLLNGRTPRKQVVPREA